MSDETKVEDLDSAFSIESFIIAPDYTVSGSTVKVNDNKVNVCKPNKEWFFRVNPDPQYTCDALIYEPSEGMQKEQYFVHPSMEHCFTPGFVSKRRILVCKTRQNMLFLWPAKLPGEKENSWIDSAWVAIEKAKTQWVSMRSNQIDNSYDVYIATAKLSEPDWSQLLPFMTLLKRGFKKSMITSEDHHVIRNLRGEI